MATAGEQGPVRPPYGQGTGRRRPRHSLTPSSPAGHSAHGTGSAHQPGAAKAAGQLAPPRLCSGSGGARRPLRSATMRAGRPRHGHPEPRCPRARLRVCGLGRGGRRQRWAQGVLPRSRLDGPNARAGPCSGPEAPGFTHLSCHLFPTLVFVGWGRKDGQPCDCPGSRRQGTLGSPGPAVPAPLAALPWGPRVTAPRSSGTFLSFSVLEPCTACHSHIQPRLRRRGP